jgi:hypothetical protein
MEKVSLPPDLPDEPQPNAPTHATVRKMRSPLMVALFLSSKCDGGKVAAS